MIPVARLAFFAFTLLPSLAHAWSATGHHVIAGLAFDHLTKPEQIEVMRILATHPEFDRRFKPPEGMTDQRSIDRWRIGVAGCWPDLVRKTDYDRPTWHYQFAGTALVGDKSKVNPPKPPGPLPTGATLATQDLYIGQAVELCRQVFAD